MRHRFQVRVCQHRLYLPVSPVLKMLGGIDSSDPALARRIGLVEAHFWERHADH